MIHARLSSPYSSDEETIISFEGPDEDAAWNIVATRFSALDYLVHTWNGEEWILLGEEE